MTESIKNRRGLPSRRAPITLSTLGASAHQIETPAVRLYDNGNGIFSIRITPPTNHKTASKDVIGHLLQALDRVQQEKSLKVLTIDGAERLLRGEREDYNEAVTRKLFEAIVTFPRPTIAVVQSDAIGAGFLFAALCDFMVCNEDVNFAYTITQRQFYPTPAETLLFSERFGEARAHDFLFLSPALTGRQLRAKGWTCPIIPGAQVELHAQKLAAAMATKSQDALRLLKQHLARHLIGLVQGLAPVETQEPDIEHSFNAAKKIASPVKHIHLDAPAANVLLIKFGDVNKKPEINNLIEDLGHTLAEVSRTGCYKAIVLASAYPEFLPSTEQDEKVISDFQRLIVESEIPTIAALDGNAKGNAWVIAQLCDACVYSETGTYSAAAVGQSSALARTAAGVFMHRFGSYAGTQVLLMGADYSGVDLQRLLGALTVAEPDRVVSTAIRMAEFWTKLPRTALFSWKKNTAKALEKKIRQLPEKWEWQDEARESLLAVPRPIPLRSKVVTATAHPEGIVVAKIEDRQAKNMFSDAFIEGIIEVFAHIEQNPAYKVVILTGYDSYFACGGTKEGLLAIQEGKALFTDFKVCQLPLECKVPVIAAMQGHGIGAGLSLGMLADIVLLSEESKYVSPFMNYGFTPGAGATWILPDKIGYDLARESLLTGQHYAGSELRERGVSLPVLPRADVYPTAMALAKQIVSHRSNGLKQKLTSHARLLLEETYRHELAMHEKTFAGQSDTLALIENNFPQVVGLLAGVQSSAPEPANPCFDTDVLATISATLKAFLAKELHMSESDIDENEQFIDLGLDSIGGVTWLHRINEEYQTSIEVTKVYSYPTLTQFSRYVKEQAQKHGTLSTPGAAPELDRPAASNGAWSLIKIADQLQSDKLTSWRKQRTSTSRFISAPASRAGSQAIAVIGMAGQFPQAKTLEEFWENIAQGKNCITQVPPQRWDLNAYYQPGEVVAGKSNSQWLGALEDYDRFDPLFFNISPSEAESMDPQQRLFLQACWHGIEDAGYDARSLSESKCGVFVGCASGYYHQLSREHQLSAQGFTGAAMSILAARISYFLNLQGPCLSIDTACSSSLVAIAHACDSLISGGSDLALAGGVYVMAGPELHIMTSQAGMLSPQGQCFTFDQRADGFVPGEGVGVVMLKRLADAERDGDIIQAVIQGWGVNQDGKTNGITAPNSESQTLLEQEVYDKYGIDPGSIQLVEAHGTGTKLGDPIEVEGLKKAFAKYTQNQQYCALGSVKSNIGHCLAAAGIAGVIKLILALKHKQLPPTINFEQLNEHIELKQRPFYINRSLLPWELKGGQRRQSAISSFGFSGTNAHMVIGEYQPPVEVKPPVSVVMQDGKIIIPLSAKTPEQLQQKARELLAFIRKEKPSIDLIEMAYTLQVGREPMEERLGFLVSSVEQLIEKLDSHINGERVIKDVYQGQAKCGKDSTSIISQDDETKQTIVEKWLTHKKLSKLLDLWVKGLQMDWNKFYGEIKPRRTSLPLYPFAKERYWIDTRADGRLAAIGVATSVLHPLLHSNTSDLSEQRYSSIFTGEEFFLNDHRVRSVGGRVGKVLPGVAYLEMARAGIEQAWPGRLEATVLELRNTLWAQPIIVAEKKQVSLALVANDNEEIEYEIYSQKGGERIVHCQGRAVWSREAAAAKLDLEQLKGEMRRGRVEPSRVYAAFTGMGLAYGPAFQGMTALYRGSNQVLAQVRLPRAVEDTWGDYGLHPSLLDSALQAAVGLIQDGSELLKQTQLPFALEKLRILSPCRREMAAWVRYSTGSQPGDNVVKLDIDLCDEQGNVCVQMQGFSLRLLKPEEGTPIHPQQEIKSGLQSFVPVWNLARPEALKKTILSESKTVLLLGGEPTHWEWVRKTHTNASLLAIPAASTIDSIQAKLKDCAFDHLLWIAPDVSEGDVGFREDEVQVIEHQERGVLAVFRIIKALLRLGYGDRKLRWTLLTGQTQRVKKGEQIQPTHAAIFGLIGSLAKEYPHWELSLLDVDCLESVTAQECLSMATDKRGNGLAYRQGEWFDQEFAHLAELPQSLPILYRQKGVYVVIGGAGGLGEVWTRFMMERYQAQVVWIGRRPYDRVIEEKIKALAGLGPAPLYISADATKVDELEEARETTLKRYSAIHGVVHSAIVLQDQSLAGMEEPKFRASLSAKIDVSVNMNRVFGRQELDFMLFFSSIMSFIKSAGQSNYAAGSTFKDSFAQKLQGERAYPVKIMNWGYWGSVGVVADKSYSKAMAQLGVGSIEPHEGMGCLQTFVGCELGQMALIKMLDAQTLVSFSERLTYYPKVGVSAPWPAPTDSLQQACRKQLAAVEKRLQDPGMDALLAEMLAASLVSLGLFWLGVGRLGELGLDQQGAPFYERWLSCSIGYLQERKLLGQDLTVSPGVRALADLWQEWEGKKSVWASNPDRQAQVALLKACVTALPDILSGKRLATEVMFPDSSLQLVEGIYQGNAQDDYFNGVLGQTLSAWIEQKRNEEKEPGIRILEIGAGTGATTKKLLPLCTRFAIAEYCYTDVSKAFLMYAEEHYQPRLPALTTAIFDVSKPLAGQSIAADHYDVVIATNVLHATANIRETLRNVKATLKNQGIVLLNEISSWSLFAHLTFGLLEGWWLAEDRKLRLPGSPGLAPEKWREVLEEEGFASIFFPAEAAHQYGQQIIVASSDGWVRQPLTASPAAVREREPSVSTRTLPAIERMERGEGEESLREKSIAYFQKLVASTLKMRPDRIEAHRPLAEYGLDSILVGQLTYQLREVFTDVTGTLFFEVQSIAGLVDYFLENKKAELVGMLSEIAGAAAQPLLPAASEPRTTVRQSLRRPRGYSRPSAGSIAQEPKTSAGAPSLQPAFSTPPNSQAASVFDVAIVGLSGRYPQSRNLKEFWANLANGVNCVREIPRDRWHWEKYYDPEKGKPGKIYTQWGGFIEGIDQFDPLFFRISPKEAKRMDPQERLFVESCYHAIEDAGYTLENLGKPDKIGVFVGVMNGRYTPQPAHSSIANRVSYLFNFQGPSMAVDTACSSSLTAIHVALESMYSGESACAIAGGVNVIIDPVHFMQLTEMTMLSSGNQCKAFGEQADGMVDAEGIGAVVLKPLPQAQADGDHIYGVIKGSAINAGGRTNGYTVPNPKAQSRVVSLALQRAQVSAEDISYVEAHGTGTALGDPIEIAGLTRAFEKTSDKKQFCSIGSLKSNIGHCESAAGIAGLTKVLLQMKYQQLVPSLHADVPNSEIDFAKTPFKVQKSLEKWQRPQREVNRVIQEIPRMAGVSSFGAGGSNAHVIVQEYVPPTELSQTAAPAEKTKTIIVLSARSAEQLKQKARDLLAFIQEEQQSAIAGKTLDLAAMAYTLQVGREAMEERLAMDVRSAEQVVEKLKAYLAGEAEIEDLYQGQVKPNKEVLSVFSSDADLQQTVEKWVANRKFSKLLDLWVRGVEVDWSKLYGEVKPQRMSLPPYPFARERYWIDTTAGKPAAGSGVSPAGLTAAVLHPLLHSNTSDLSEQRYSTTFTGDEFFLADHQVAANGHGKVKVLPGMAYLEMARAAVEKAWPAQPGSSILELHNTVWAQPIIVNGSKQVSLGLWANQQDRLDYEIYSQDGDQEIVHCQGRALWSREPTPARLDVDQLKREMGRGPVEPSSVYAACTAMGFVYGPSLQGIIALHRGSNQVLAELQPPQVVEDTRADYVLHPSVMESAVQACVGLMESEADGSQHSRLPFALERLRIISPCTQEMLAWVRYAAGSQAGDKVVKLDIDLCDEQGNISAQVRGASWQRAAEVEPVINIEASAAAEVKKEIISPAPVRKEIPFRTYPPTTLTEVERKKPNAIALSGPGIQVLDESTFPKNRARTRASITLSGPAHGVADTGRAAAAGVSFVKLFDCGDGVFLIQMAGWGTSHRPSREMIAQLLQALERVQQEGSVKVVLLSRTEGGWGSGGREEYNEAVAQGLYQAIVSFPYPVIAVVQGDAAGAGFLLAGLSDFMVLNEEGKYGYTDAESHLYPTLAETKLFDERFGAVQAQDFLYISKDLTGGDLRRKGWTCPIVPKEQVDSYAEQLARSLAAKPQEALRLLKQHLAHPLVEVIKELKNVEIAGPETEGKSVTVAKEKEIVTPAAHIHVETPTDKVVVVKFRARQTVGARELVAELASIFARVQQVGSYKAIVLVSESANFFAGTEQAVAEEDVLAFQQLVEESEIPVVAALAGNAKGSGWLMSQFCDACVYSQTGVYSSDGMGPSSSVAQRAAVLFGHRLGSCAGKEVLLSGAEYSGAELKQRVGALLAAEREEVLARALRVAELWAKLPRATLASWKKHTATTLQEKTRRLPAASVWEKEEERKNQTSDPLPAAPTPIALQSKVITATAHPEGIVVVKMEERPAKNMFSKALLEGISEVFAHIEETPGYKVVVLTGYDSYFASGGTKESLLAIQAGTAKFTDNKIFAAALECKLPVIAAMQGHGIGAGWVLGMMADVVLLSAESRYVSPYMNYGFTPGAGATWILGEKLGQDLARESLLTGQPYSGRELKERGLQLSVVPRAEVYEAAMARARQMARGSRERLLRLKQQWRGYLQQALEETYALELAMHEKTFVGQAETLAQIEKNFYQDIEPRPESESRTASPEQVHIEAEDQWLDSDVLRAVTATLKTLLANQLQMQESDIDENVQFVDLGLDSITGVMWIRKINERYHIAIKATKVYNYPTLKQLSRYVKEEAVKQGRLASPGAASAERTSVEIAPATRAATRLETNKLTSWRSRRAWRFASTPAAPTISATPSSSQSQAIAVIGMAGQFPQAKNLEEFWQNLAQGKNCITQVPRQRWDVDVYYQAGEVVAGRTNSQWVGALEEYDCFDPLFFNISPTEAESMDPQQRLFLQACWHSIEHAGYDARVLSGSKCGVFVGCATGDYHQLSRQHRLSAQGFTGSAMAILAARISYFLNLQGPCISIDTACSSSLVALAHACDSLICGNSDLALAGGVYVMAGPELHIMTSQAGMLSPEGRCFTFDQRADGMVPGEGVGVVLLKRLADAERDQDLIYGVIEGWGVNQDGKTNGITAPNPESQTRLEQEVYDKYGIDPASIQLIEAHGTATKLGDPIEVEGLKNAFKKYTEKKEYCALGSVKSNIGHCATAAGIAGAIKVILALRHKQLPPTINFERLNEHIELKDSPFYINSRLQEWKLNGGARRQAAISSFGFSGTNAHMVIGEYLPPAEARPGVVTPNTKILVPLSAKKPEQLQQKAWDLLDFIRKEPGVDLEEMAYTLQVGRGAMEERVGFLVSSLEQLAEQLEAYIEGKKEIKDFYQGQVQRSKENLSIAGQDDEMKEAIMGRWIAQNRLSKLLDLWVKGLEMDWSRLYGAVKPQRISLPLYPFAKERYWIDTPAGGQVAGSEASTAFLHPLLHSNTSDLSEQRYSSTFTGEEFFLADHQVRMQGGRLAKVLPAVAYLEMARAAVEQALPSQSESSILELRDIVWLEPIIVEDRKQISIVLFANDDGTIGYNIFSIESEQRITHCEGQAAFIFPPKPANMDIEQLKRQTQEARLESSIIYPMLAEIGLRYGPAHQGIAAIYLGEKQVLAQLRLPAVVESSQHKYVLHPSLMDSALQASIGLLRDRIPNRPSLPFVLDSLRIISHCPTEVLGWVRYAQRGSPEDTTMKLDIDICDQQGNVCVQIRGFTSRALDDRVKAIQEPAVPIFDGENPIVDDSLFDSAFYQKLIVDIANHEVSVDEALELG